MLRTSASMSTSSMAWVFSWLASARAKASNWLVRWAARSVLSAICRSRMRMFSGSVSVSASSVCIFKPVSGVRNWCAASPMKRCWACRFCSRRAIMSLKE